MASRVVTQLVSDLTGKEIAEGDGETIEFSYRGGSYAIDLTVQEAERFDSAVANYLGHARPVGNKASRRNTSNQPDAKTVRAWARENGLDVPERGRIPAAIHEMYALKH